MSPHSVFRKVVRVFTLAAFLFIGGIAGYAAERETGFHCTSQAILIKDLLTRQQQAYAATAIEDRHFVVDLFIGVRTGNWTIIGIDSNDNACVLLKGNTFMSAVSGGA